MLRAKQFVIWVVALSLAACATAQQAVPAPAEGAAAVANVQETVQPPPAESPSSAADAPEVVQPKVAPLLMLILSGFASGLGSQLGSGAGKDFVKENPGFFTSLLKRLGWRGAKDETKADASAAADGSLAPAVGYALQKLDPGSFEVVAALEVGEAPTLLKTGDVFAIQYSTNLPGLIRLENVDPKGRVSNLGTYTVLVDQLNRLPRDRGIRLEGEPGTEILKIYFYPCLPPEAAGQPWGVRMESQLPNCRGAQNTLVADAANGTVQTRSLVNLSQPDPTMAFAGVADYQKNEVTLAIVRIKHERPGDGK